MSILATNLDHTTIADPLKKSLRRPTTGLAGRAYLPFLEAGAVDVAIVDCLWNGVGESVKIAALCDLFEVNCAAHNYRASQPHPVVVRPLLLCSLFPSRSRSICCVCCVFVLLCSSPLSLPFPFSVLCVRCAAAAPVTPVTPVTPRALRLPADGWLGTAISAHFCAAIPNYKVLEVDVDDVYVPGCRTSQLLLREP